MTLQLNHALSTPPDNFFLQPKTMYYPLHIKAALFINFCATVIVGMWVVLLQRLQQRIKQHIPKTILQGHTSQDRSTFACSYKPIRSPKGKTSFSAIGQHLLQNPICAREYHDGKFSILARGRTSFHLSTLEAT